MVLKNIKRKGIILAGGSGTRLYPATKVVSKQLLPVFDKPMIYYPLSTLMLTDIRDILIISTPKDINNFEDLLGDGKQWGLKINYCVQIAPNGLAEALILAEEFLNGSPSTLILGDNIFYGDALYKKLASANRTKEGATVFGYHVHDPQRYGVVEFNHQGKIISIEEKPEIPKSNYALTGLYFYDGNASSYAKQIKPSDRNELEITDLNKIYLDKGQLNIEIMKIGDTWLDTGTHESLIEANQFVQTIQNRQGLKISCPEEIAFKKKWIDKNMLKKLAEPMLKNSYGQYIMQLLNDFKYEDN